MRGRQRRLQLGLLLLATQLYQAGLNNIPPATLAVLGLNVYLFLFPAAPLMETCVSVQETYRLRDWRRLLLSPVHHADDLHLYFNMVSFLVKGIRLERRLGSAWFFYMVSVFSLLVGVVYLGLEAALTELTHDQSHSMDCVVGFSGVIFALKVLSNHYHRGGVTYVLGYPVSNCYASWVELVLIHITAPGTSLIGHLSGILVGLLYTTGPLEKMMKICAAWVTASTFTSSSAFASSGYSGTNGGYSRRSHAYTTADSSHAREVMEEEELAAAIRNSLNDRGRRSQREAPPPAYGFRLSEEELRWRRLRRFDS
ncbi:rhomboid-related protein 4 isoform X2 [Nerophis lumbriciformis]|uniref:rhomboid-related protein 4 isoform X2 n=1 Tax=Nerophis lumbriciformis TaxID=546530 RepID=UPI002ADF7312|nr:rhomboid-related protein 4-like isoform X2 [Nerophis lumbriciformis]